MTGERAQPTRVAILGAGLMGAQIGAEYALAGHDVVLITRSAASGSRAIERAHAAIDALTMNGLASDAQATAARRVLRATDDVARACADRDLIVESVAEDLEQKGAVLGVAARAAPRATLCSNTSSIPITAIGRAARAPDRVLGTHYANPAILVPLVEVVAGRDTHPGRIEHVMGLLVELGKTPIMVPDIPGFLWNRLQFALLREAVRLVTEYGVEPAAIDVSLRRVLGRRWSLIGPFETVALGGRDTFIRIANMLFADLDRPVDPAALEQIALPQGDALRTRALERDARLLELLKQDVLTNAPAGASTP